MPAHVGHLCCNRCPCPTSRPWQVLDRLRHLLWHSPCHQVNTSINRPSAEECGWRSSSCTRWEIPIVEAQRRSLQHFSWLLLTAVRLYLKIWIKRVHFTLDFQKCSNFIKISTIFHLQSIGVGDGGAGRGHVTLKFAKKNFSVNFYVKFGHFFRAKIM